MGEFFYKTNLGSKTDFWCTIFIKYALLFIFGATHVSSRWPVHHL